MAPTNEITIEKHLKTNTIHNTLPSTGLMMESNY